MKSLKNYDGNFEIFERKNKFKNHKQNYKKEKTLCGDYFIDISDYRDDENSINKNFINLCKEEKFIRIDQNISIEEDDLIDTFKEEDESENKNNMYMMASYDKYSNDSNYSKENEDPNILILTKEKYINMNEIEKENKQNNKNIIYNDINEDKDMSRETSKYEIESDFESEKKYYELRKEVVTRINSLNNEEIIDLLVYLENIRPQAIQELPNDSIYINVEQFNDDTFYKVLDYLTSVYIID